MQRILSGISTWFSDKMQPLRRLFRVEFLVTTFVMGCYAIWVAMFTAPLDIPFRVYWWPPIGMAVMALCSVVFTNAVYNCHRLPFDWFLPEVFAAILAYALCYSFFTFFFGLVTLACATSRMVGIIVAGLMASWLTIAYRAIRVRWQYHRQPTMD